MSLLVLNGLRISEALGADITAIGSERGHRTLTVLRKRGEILTIPLAPRAAWSLDLAIGGTPPASSPPTSPAPLAKRNRCRADKQRGTP